MKAFAVGNIFVVKLKVLRDIRWQGFAIVVFALQAASTRADWDLSQLARLLQHSSTAC
jgi:hypothetical protein